MKDKKITLKIENNTITFSQKYDLNTTSSYFKTQTLVHLSEELKPNELLTVNQDSIYISANYNNKKIKKIAIAKSDLLGIQVSCQTIKELKKDGIQFFFTVIFLVISLFLWEFKYIIFGFIILSIIISVVFYYNKKPKT
ncbi:MAG: hypothetical protein LBN95_04690 [Prevotellaceae bacterium]|nr:hypothetical protein [Prevotellaceae bacterium]